MVSKQKFALEKMDERFRKSAVNYSIICIAFVAAAAESKLNFDVDMFETAAIDPVILIEEHNSQGGIEDVTVGVSGYNVEDEKIYVDIFGENNSNENMIVTSGVFILSSFNKTAAEPRYHYYADNWQDMCIPANSSYKFTLVYDVDGIGDKINSNYIFTLSAFRNIMDRETVEIIINK